MSVTIPSLSDVTDILDTDMVMVTQSGGQTYKISGADLNKRNQAVIASSTTLTGAPLKTGNIVRVHFTADITGVNTTTALSLSYNGTSKTVKVPKDGALVNFTAQNLGGSPTVYKYLQAYTTLELLYDGTNFVIIGNPVVLSSSTYLYYADGTHNVNSVTSGNIQSVTSGAVAQEIQPLKELYVLESGVYLPVSINANNHKNYTVNLRRTYKFSNVTNIMFVLTPVSYVDTAFCFVTGHWGGSGQDASSLTESNKITVYITNMYSAPQVCGFYWAILGTKNNYE